MSHVTVDVVSVSDPDLSDLMRPGEQLLWSGRPEHGTGFFQPVGEERVYLGAMAVGTVILWAAFPLVISETAARPGSIALVFGALTLGFVVKAWADAASRQHEMSRMLYLVTNQRAMVCRSERNWRLANRLHVISSAHSPSYPYEILPTRPHPSVKLGRLLGGAGPSLLGELRDRGPRADTIVFEQISEAAAVLDLIRSHAR